MSIFGKIKDAIFGHKDVSPEARPQIPAGMDGGPPAGTTTIGGTATTTRHRGPSRCRAEPHANRRVRRAIPTSTSRRRSST